MRARHIYEGPEHRMRGHVLDALAIDPDLAAVADRVPVLLSRADHRVPIGSVNRRLALSRRVQSAPTSRCSGSGWHITCSFERQSFCAITRRGGLAMAEVPRLLMVIGAATPPGGLAAAITAAAEAVRSNAEDINVDVMNLAEVPIDTCDGRPLDSYGAETRQAVDQIAAAAAALIAAPVYRASFPGVLKNLLDIVPVEALQGKPVGIVAMGGSAHHYLAIETQLR